MKTTTLVGLTAALLGLAFTGCARSGGKSPDTQRKDFSEQEVAEIKAQLSGMPASSYRLLLPLYRNQTMVGTETVGTLPFTEVQRLASLKGQEIRETANLQAIVAGDESGGGGGGGGGPGNGPGSHINSTSAGTDVINRIDLMMKNVETNRYVFIH